MSSWRAERLGRSSYRGVLLHAGATVILQGTCHSLRAHNDHRNLLSRKAHWPRGSVQGQPRANMAVLMGSQLLVGWHVPLRIIARIAMTSQDGTVVKHSLAVRQCGGWWRAAR